MNKVDYFYFVRDIPYKIPTFLGEPDYCCSGKHRILLDLLRNLGLQVRYRVCLFLWSDLGLQPRLERISHDDDCTHTYLEFKVGENWKVLDATWDVGLAKVFFVNEWNGKSKTKIAVKPIEVFSPMKSRDIVRKQTKKVIEEDLKINRKFYKAFNKWLEKIRTKG